LLEHVPPGDAVTVDGLAAAAELGVADVLAELLRLEVAGAVERDLDGRFRRRSGMVQPR
jgi:predicted Rossmann fold nucleotide-binding protein DprA/Smf involved in DNA uptake